MAETATHRLPPRTLTLIVLLLVMWLVEAASPAHAQRWREQEGRWEFTGKMVVRPLQVEHSMERGFSRERAEELYAEATAYTVRTLGDHVYRYFDRMDEYWFNVPEGRTENDFGEELLATGYYRYVCPNWKTYPTAFAIEAKALDDCPDDPLLDEQWHLKRIEACAAWQIWTDGDDDIVIGVSDTGMEVGHEDLSDYRQEGYDGSARKWESDGGDISDWSGICHGSIVLGAAAATGNNNLGVSGMGWTLRHRMLSFGSGMTDDVINTFWVSAEAGDRVICSTSGDDFTDSLIWQYWEDNTETILYYYSDLLIVHSAGNDPTWDYPPFTYMIMVGGTDKNDEPWEFTSAGSFIDAMAPAEGIYSTKCGASNAYGKYLLGGGSGTSFATPQVAGLCALIWSFDPSLTANEVRSFLYAGCDAFNYYDPDDHGHGRINAFNSLMLATGDLWTRDPYPGEAGAINKFKADGAANGATARFYYGSSTGQTAVSGCTNVNVGIANASILGTATAESNGSAILTATVPSG